MFVNGSFSDVDAFGEAISETWRAEFYPLAQERAAAPAVLVVQSGVPTCQYMFCEFALALRLRGDPPKGLITFNLLEPFPERYWWRGYDILHDHVFVFTVGSELEGITPHKFQVHTISMTEEALAVVAARCEIRLPPLHRMAEVFRPPEDLVQNVRRDLRRFRRDASLFSETHAQSFVARLLPHWTVEDGTRFRPQLRARHLAVKRSLEVIEGADLAEMSPQTLLDVAGVSERTLQYAFQERFHTSPAAFLKARRLGEVRERLRHADPHTARIGEIAAELGFWHLGQFSSDYKRHFGERPSGTLWNGQPSSH